MNRFLLILAIFMASSIANGQFGGGGGGQCGGDLIGTYPNCLVGKINGVLPAAIATSGNASDLIGTLPKSATPVPSRPVSTVAALPQCTALLKGQMNMVSDALAPVMLAGPVAGGLTSVGVTCDGSKWIVQ